MVDEAVRHHDQLLGESDSVNYDIRTLHATIHKMNHQVETEQAKEQEISQRMRQMKEQTNGEIRQITESITQLQRVVVDDSDSHSDDGVVEDDSDSGDDVNKHALMSLSGVQLSARPSAAGPIGASSAKVRKSATKPEHVISL